MEEDKLACRKKAMLLLKHNDRTEWELRDRLKKAGFDEILIDDALSYVRGFHYIDDRRYAMRFAEIYKDRRSIQRIRQDLQNKHVSEEDIEMALENISYDDSLALKKELEKRLKGREALSYEEKQKIAASLYRKGFRPDDIFQEMEAACQ